MKASLEKKLVLICNSELDGFNEGDGDLMEKLVMHLNGRGHYVSTRIVYNGLQVPPSKRTLVAENQLVILGSNTPKSPEDFKGRLFPLLLERYSEYQEKIFYIGSRFDKVTPKEGSYDINGSGSFFTSDVIVKLKQMNFKVVICCLEYKFFRRSITQLTTAATMLKEQLFHADGIHFLNHLDLIDFNSTIDSFVTSPYLEALPGVVKNDVYQANIQHFDCTKAIESIGLDELKKLKQKAKHIPGIYTVQPLPLLTNSAKDISLLINRPPNLMCFGLIRKHKGVEEAIDLARTLHAAGDNRQIFIVGKIMGASLLFLRNILKEIYQFTLRDYSDIAISLLTSKYNVISGLDSIVNKRMVDFSKFNENTLNGGKDTLNEFCTDVIQQCDLKFNKHLNIVILLNLPEVEIHKVALKCRYAIKLDHKGMADNASTIVSCLGLCLPTFTACGLLTDECFRDPALQPTIPTSANCYRFKDVVIMPTEKYEDISTEIAPINFTSNEICGILNHEDNEIYSRRIEQLLQLRQSRMYDVDIVVERLERELFDGVVFTFGQQFSYKSVK